MRVTQWTSSSSPTSLTHVFFECAHLGDALSLAKFAGPFPNPDSWMPPCFLFQKMTPTCARATGLSALPQVLLRLPKTEPGKSADFYRTLLKRPPTEAHQLRTVFLDSKRAPSRKVPVQFAPRAWRRERERDPDFRSEDPPRLCLRRRRM